MKICFPTSSGGHLTHLKLLENWYKNHEVFWVTFDKVDANSVLSDQKKYYCYSPTNRNVKNLLKNALLAVKILHKEKPDLIVSTGAGVAVPFFIIGKLFGIKTVYIEVFDRIYKPTLTGKLVYRFSDIFLIQWDEQKKNYKKGVNIGKII